MILLEKELEEKDKQLVALTAQLRQVEHELEISQQQLTLLKETTLVLQTQVSLEYYWLF